MYVYMYVYVCYIYTNILFYVHIYDSQIVQPTPQCFKSSHPVYLVNDC